MAQYFPCPQCSSTHRSFSSLTNHHLQNHKQAHRKFIKEYLPAFRVIRLTCIFCHCQFPEKAHMIHHYRRCEYAARKQTPDEHCLNGIVAWNTDVWLTPQFKNSIFKYLSGRPQPNIPKVLLQKPLIQTPPKSDMVTKQQEKQREKRRQTKKNIRENQQPARVPCPECDVDYKNHKDLKVHFSTKHLKRLQSQFLTYYYPIIKTLAECTIDADLIDPTTHPDANYLSAKYLQKLQRYYSTKLHKK